MRTVNTIRYILSEQQEQFVNNWIKFTGFIWCALLTLDIKTKKPFNWVFMTRYLKYVALWQYFNQHQLCQSRYKQALLSLQR